MAEHIASNLGLEAEDFELPPFNQRGGLGKVHQLFGAGLPKVIEALTGSAPHELPGAGPRQRAAGDRRQNECGQLRRGGGVMRSARLGDVAISMKIGFGRWCFTLALIFRVH